MTSLPSGELTLGEGVGLFVGVVTIDGPSGASGLTLGEGVGLFVGAETIDGLLGPSGPLGASGLLGPLGPLLDCSSNRNNDTVGPCQKKTCICTIIMSSV